MEPVSAQAPQDVDAAGSPDGFYDQLKFWVNTHDFSDKTVGVYSMAARKWIEFARPWEPMWEVRSIEWRKSMQQFALKTQALFVGAAKLFVNHLIRTGMLHGENPLATVRFRGTSTDYVRRRALTDEEVRNLLASCDLRTETGLRDHTILKIMLHVALRIGSVASICVEDVKRRGDVWTVTYLGKGQRSKVLTKVLPAAVLDAIRAYVKKTGRKMSSTGALFLGNGRPLTIHGMRKAIIRRLKKIGIDDETVTTHSLRHTAATKAIKSGNDIKSVQKLLDHANIATTDRYIHSVDDEQRALDVEIRYDEEEPDGAPGEADDEVDEIDEQ